MARMNAWRSLLSFVGFDQKGGVTHHLHAQPTVGLLLCVYEEAGMKLEPLCMGRQPEYHASVVLGGHFGNVVSPWAQDALPRAPDSTLFLKAHLHALTKPDLHGGDCLGERHVCMMAALPRLSPAGFRVQTSPTPLDSTAVSVGVGA
jgi:hypothetical protein